ncbi:hypothetical protein RJ639_037565 [Escallonia herrerae]|uniref:ZF-HD dimerization-type domain-containing protein n=1 Tax=Escallonia herrerae TaxID=1293975 RepID=A0AA89BCX2_9ASTE|nr:hypothetical protein RJ639_037565 [Escallonia herrerae]
MAFQNGGVHTGAARPDKVVRYEECQRNHAAQIMSFALDGCGLFEPSGESGTPESQICACCGCNRSFHRKVEVQVLAPPPPPPPLATTPHRGPQILRVSHSPPISPPQPQPPPIIYRYARRSVAALPPPPPSQPTERTKGKEMAVGGERKKGKKTKFTGEQKERLKEFAERLGWRMKGSDEEGIRRFCSENGIERLVFRNWINNNRPRKESGQSTLE